MGIKKLQDFNVTPPFESKKLIIHESYDERKKENDIALIQLNDTVDLSKKNILAKLYKNNNLPTISKGSILQVLGWGGPNSGIDNNFLLQKKFVTLDFNVNCDIYDNKESIIFTDGKNGPYEGDSGGPLLYQNYIIGIVSGEPCDKKSYSSVNYFYSWIWSHV